MNIDVNIPGLVLATLAVAFLVALITTPIVKELA